MYFQGLAYAALLLACAQGLGGCSYITDEERRSVATLNGEPITLGELEELIYNMADDERPIIQRRDDYLEVLNEYINERIKDELAKALKAEGKIQVSRDVARQEYLSKHPDYMSVYQIQTPELLGMTAGDVIALKAEIEFGIDDVEDGMLREEALRYTVRAAYESGRIQVSAEEVSAEYANRGDELIKLELVDFKAIQFPISDSGASAEAASVRRRVDEGEAFEEILASYVKKDSARGVNPLMENDPANPRYRMFWDVVSGCEVGDIIGPVLMPESNRFMPGRNGGGEWRLAPAAQLVLKVIAHEPARPKTLEEAQPELLLSLVRGEVIEQLRRERGVEVFPENLPRPEGYGDQYEGTFIDTGK